MPLLEKLNQKLTEKDKDYKRAQLQTYMTAPEWRNVDMAGEMASFAELNKPFYLFPYFSQVYDFWRILKNSAKSARKKGASWKEILFSEFFMMDAFIGCFTTVEYMVKGILSLPFKALSYITVHQTNETDTQANLAEMFRHYADYIHHTPFYDYSYALWLPKLWSTFWHSSNKKFSDFLSLIYFSIELPFRGLIATPVAWVYNSEENQAYETIDVVFSHKVDETNTPESCEQQAKAAIEFVKSVNPTAPLGSLNVLPACEEDKSTDSHKVVVENAVEQAYVSARLPRYEPLMTAIQAMSKTGFHVKRIAGQSHVQLKCKITAENGELDQHITDLTKSINVSKLYNYKNHIDPNIHFVMLDVLTEDLNEFMERVQATEHSDLVLIHDF